MQDISLKTDIKLTKHFKSHIIIPPPYIQIRFTAINKHTPPCSVMVTVIIVLCDFVQSVEWSMNRI